MQSDQKIGLCLLIGLLGFATAIGFGRRERPVALPEVARQGQPSAEELLPIDQLTASPDDEVDAQPQLTTIELTPPAIEEVGSPIASPVDADSSSEKANGERSPFDLGHNPIGESPAIVHEANLQPEQRTSDPVPAESLRTYVVQPGDTLSGIAVKHLGDGNRYLDVYRANRDILAHPDALAVGQTIRIPPLQRPVEQTASADSWFSQ